MTKSTLYVKDKIGIVIGRVEYDSSGNGTGISLWGSPFAGVYNHSADTTFTANGSVYCRGDGLATLVRECAMSNK